MTFQQATSILGRILLTTGCLGLLSVLNGATAQGSTPDELLKAFESSLTKVISKVEPSVVAILQSPTAQTTENNAGKSTPFSPDDSFGALRTNPPADGEMQVSGAGVAIGQEYVLTQYLSVTLGKQHVVATHSGLRLKAEIVGADPRSALAVLRVTEPKLHPIEMGDAEQLRKGTLVATVSNPYAIATDGQASAAFGTVTNFAQKAPQQENLNNVSQNNFRTTLHHLGTLIQTDAQLGQKGDDSRLGWNSSGGALVDFDGKLVGLTTSLASIAGHEQAAGYAIPINAPIRRIIGLLQAGKEVEYGLLGISFNPERAMTNGQMGVPVRQVFRGSAAQRAGLRVGDLIASVDGKPTTSTDRLQLTVGALPPSRETQITYERSGTPRTATVRLDKIFVPGEKVITNRPPAWQGIRVDYTTAVDATQFAATAAQPHLDPQGCVAVVEVAQDSLSWKQGVRPGMYISHVSGERVRTPEDFRQAIRRSEGKVKLRFTAGNTPQGAKAVE